MIVVPPVNLVPYQLTVIGASDPTPVWSSSTTYNIGDIVSDWPNSLRLHKSLIASNTLHIPPRDGTSSAQWLDIGPTNITQCLDYTSNKQTIADSSNLGLSFSSTANRIDTIAVINMDADQVEVRIENNGAIIYDQTELLYSRTVLNWYDYFYKSFRFKTSSLFTNLPQSLSYTYAILLSTSGRVVKCGGLIVGTAVYLGATQYDPTISTINYSTITRDTFGNAVLIPRRNVPNNTVTTQIPAINVDDAIAARDALNAVPGLWSGLDDDTQPYFGSLLTFGVYTQFDIDPFSVDYATLTLQLQEF